MIRTVIGTFDSFADAQEVVRDLVDEGYTARSISVLAPKASTRGAEQSAEGAPDARSKGRSAQRLESAAASAAAGSVVGGAAGLVASLIWFVLPGIGQIAASGPIVVALSGAAAGAVAGGLIAALVELGVPEQHARQFSEALRRGSAMITLRCDGTRAERAAEIMCDHGAIDIERRAEMWRRTAWHPQLRYASENAPTLRH